jgi:hypothetical protein
MQRCRAVSASVVLAFELFWHELIGLLGHVLPREVQGVCETSQNNKIAIAVKTEKL